MKKFILLLIVGVVCSPLLVTSAQAKSVKLHKAHKVHHWPITTPRAIIKSMLETKF